MSDRDSEDLTAQLEWVQLADDLALIKAEEETKVERFIRKFKENPLVPLGVLATTGAITYGIYNWYLGDSKMQQKMMRYRVGFQFFTICAFVGGVAITTSKSGPALTPLSVAFKNATGSKDT